MPKVVPSQIVAFIDQDFPFARERRDFEVDMQFKGQVGGLLRLVGELPDELVTLDGDAYNGYVRAIAMMNSMIATWDAHGPVTHGYENRKLGAVITSMREALATMSDEVIPAATADLLFIQDDNLRESIRADVAAAEAAFVDRGWKAATVLAGAVVEALLLWAISLHRPSADRSFDKLTAAGKIRPKTSRNPDDWTLETYKLVAEDLGLIGGQTVTLVGLAQGFRNLIHPGKASRTGQQCSRSTAQAGLAAMNRLIEGFSP